MDMISLSDNVCMNSETMYAFETHATSKLCGPIVGTSNFHKHIQPLHHIGGCIIRLTRANQEDSHSNFHS